MLVSIGVATIYAVGNPLESSPASQAYKWSDHYVKQMVFALIGSLGFIAVNLIRYRRIGQISHWIYGLVLILLAYLLASKMTLKYGGQTLPLAPAGKDNVFRWIVFHSRLPRIQPSEFCKLAYIVTLAWYLRYRSNYRSIKALLGPFILTLVPIALILPEPDLGTVMLLMPVLFTMLFVAGARVKHLLLIVLLGLAVSPFFWLKMRPYQRERISSVLLQNEKIRAQAEAKSWMGKLLAGDNFSSKQWQRDHGYQLNRSKIAIATAGLTGHGHRGGDVIKYSFLPEAHNDFIFPTILQQWGGFGGVIVLGLYVVIVLCGLEIASHNTDPFGRLLTMGILTMLVFEVFVNVSMTMGLMPITGLTLPLVSYGGSSLMVSLMSIGLLNNVGRSRPFSVAKKM
jgi:cell division protein FtsW (lipid II flippase)